ncbi:cytochrome aa3 quinol oxidase subunit II [Acinetobacter sp. CUI P1]|nr:cytochrome aa3 quinol oxidase subunit II [Acinetobacter sp. CUI P1]
MKLRRIMMLFIFACTGIVAGCEPLKVLDPKGPQARTTANVIWISIGTMAVVVIVVIALFAYLIIKYRASKQSKDYEPPHIEGSLKLELIWTAIPVLIVAFLSVVTIISTYKVEEVPEGYNKKPLVIYASSSNWKWHFSYPDEDIETVNYLYIPTDRPVQFKLYSYGPISSFWIPQLGGQKYAMADMVNTLNLAADIPGEYTGRNANFSGEGFAEQTFSVNAVSPKEYEDWVREVKETANLLTEERFNELLQPGHLGQSTFNGTHLTYSPPPENHKMGETNTEEMETDMDEMNMDDMEDMENMDHSSMSQ